MKTCKKMVVLTLAFLLIFQVVGIPALAETNDPASVTASLISTDCGVAENTEYEVELHFSETNIGGAQGVVTYDPAVFTFKEVSMTQAMATANLLAAAENGLTTAGDVIKVDETAGKVTFAMLANAEAEEGEKWVTLRFTANEVTEAAVSTDFALTDVKVSNVTGTAEIPVATEGLTDVVITDTAVMMEGATIRTDGTYDLRFEITLADTYYAANDIKQVGVILVPTMFVKNGADLQNDPTGVSFCKLNGTKQVVPNIAIMDYVSDGSNKIYANVTKTGTTHMNREYSMRAFVVLTDGTVVYGDNVNGARDILDGTSSRSCKSTAVEIYEAYKANYAYSSEVEAIIAKADQNWTAAEYATVVEANLAALAAQG